MCEDNASMTMHQRRNDGLRTAATPLQRLIMQQSTNMLCDRFVVGEVQLGAPTDVDVASGVVLHNVAPAPIVATRARRIVPPC